MIPSTALLNKFRRCSPPKKPLIFKATTPGQLPDDPRLSVGFGADPGSFNRFVSICSISSHGMLQSCTKPYSPEFEQSTVSRVSRVSKFCSPPYSNRTTVTCLRRLQDGRPGNRRNRFSWSGKSSTLDFDVRLMILFVLLICEKPLAKFDKDPKGEMLYPNVGSMLF